MTKKKVSTEEFDRMVENDEDLSEVLVPVVEIKTVNLDLPTWMIEELDEQAKLLNVARKALINIWLADRLETIKEKKKA